MSKFAFFCELIKTNQLKSNNGAVEVFIFQGEIFRLVRQAKFNNTTDRLGKALFHLVKDVWFDLHHFNVGRTYRRIEAYQNTPKIHKLTFRLD